MQTRARRSSSCPKLLPSAEPSALNSSSSSTNSNPSTSASTSGSSDSGSSTTSSTNSSTSSAEEVVITTTSSSTTPKANPRLLPTLTTLSQPSRQLAWSQGSATSRQPNMMNHAVFLTPLKAQVLPKWERSVDALAADFIRFLPRTYATDNGVETWGRLPSGDSREVHTKNFLLHLARKLDDSKSEQKIEACFSSLIPNGSSEAGTAAPLYTTFFKEFTTDGLGNNPLCNAIKFMHQGIAAPAVMRLKFFILSHCMNVQYFDCRNQWDVKFSWKDERKKKRAEDGEHETDEGVPEEEIGERGKRMKITHIKWEETKPMKFEFCWCLSIEVNPTVTEILDAKMKIKHIKWVIDVGTEEKQKLVASLKGMYDGKKDIYNSPISEG